MRPIEVIRAATRTLHDRIDHGEFAHAVLDGSITMQRYASFLRAVHIVLTALEEVIELRDGAELRAAWTHGVERRERLSRDLAHLRADPRGVDAAVLYALVLAQQIRRDARHGSAIMLGYLYVIEGSQLGGQFQRKALESRPELQGGGLAYLSGAGRDTQAQFRAFLVHLESSLTDEAAVSSAVTGATRAFEGFAEIVKAVMSPSLEGRWLTEPLNPDAGTHPIPRDVREVQAALRAGERTFQTWAYYGARYGERGLRFTRSDSCWLVTLAREDAALALRHVHWLAGVLAARGMPSLLIEQHLELLHAGLTAFVPERATAYDALRAAFQVLRSERLALLDDMRMHELASTFDAEDGELSPHEAGVLLVAAVLDEKRGIGQAVESLSSWFSDTDRFSDAWRAAASRTLEAARAAC
ncbi:MAG: biliverdin-producing heme oxygenase [Polyangiales bacterium]